MSTNVSPTAMALPSKGASRNNALDGLRGITIILVMVGHAGGLLWPISRLFDIPGLRGFFGGGAVGMFFIVSGFVVGRSLLREHSTNGIDPIRFYLRRMVRLGVQVVPLAAAIIVVSLLDPTDQNSQRGTVLSALNILTHTYNQFAATDLLATRADLGHMWYLSVLQQVYLVVPLIFVALLARTRTMTVLLLQLIVVSIVWRLHLLNSEGWIEATISTVSRMDAILIGLLIALHADGLRARLSSRRAAALTVLGMGTMVVLMVILKELDGSFHYLRGWGIAFTMAAAATVIGVVCGEASPATRFLTGRILTVLGRASFVLFIWHLPLFHFVARHTSNWSWESRTFVSLTALGLLSTFMTIYVENPTRTWLASNLKGSPSSGADTVSAKERA